MARKKLRYFFSCLSHMFWPTIKKEHYRLLDQHINFFLEYYEDLNNPNLIGNCLDVIEAELLYEEMKNYPITDAFQAIKKIRETEERMRELIKKCGKLDEKDKSILLDYFKNFD